MGFNLGNIFDTIRSGVSSVGDLFTSAEQGVTGYFSSKPSSPSDENYFVNNPVSKSLASAAIGTIKSGGGSTGGSSRPKETIGLHDEMRQIGRTQGQSSRSAPLQSVDLSRLDQQWIDRLRTLANISREDTKVTLGSKTSND